MSSFHNRGRVQMFAVLFTVGMALLMQPAAAQKDNAYVVTNLVADNPEDYPEGTVALDSNLINGWGLSAGPTTPWWVSSADGLVARIYNTSGPTVGIVGLTVSVSGNPTGQVFSAGTGFPITTTEGGTTTVPARFIFAAEDGSISGWNGVLVPITQARVGLPAAGGASFKGLALAQTASGDFLYAADFHNAKVDIIDSTWKVLEPPDISADAFKDPTLPAGYAPFGIQNINGRIFVAFALQNDEADEEIAGAGLGYVSVFDTAGTFIARVASQGPLNAPWGMALAPTGFGRFSGNLLVGNFGDGRINAYNFETFEPRGHLKGAGQKPIVIDGLWGIAFGHGAGTGSGAVNELYFAAGPEEEEHGLFGKISVAP